MSRKTALIILDGVGYETAVTQCGYLQACHEAGRAKRWKMRSCIPTISLVMYETIHTGLAPVEHGILSNNALGPSQKPNIFSALRSAGKSAAVVGHAYFHTLYGGSAFDPFRHCEIDDPEAPIAHARYYSMEGYGKRNACAPAEIDLCAQATMLLRKHNPDYLLLHTSSADTIGHTFGGASPEYRRQVAVIDDALSRTVPQWLEAGYDVFVAADHGMNPDGAHGGDEPSMRDTAFYYFGEAEGPAAETVLDQRAIAPTILSRIGVDIPGSMTQLPIVS
ncbi:alkaline phosphatase family protein [Nitratireductor sp. XY-223]|uniref:alkaline phosphatase family protein n=1 Tax=Nitratireductor sp. XY-223 TaxID=2561926 RepID=UPI0010A9FAA1|nr:alkaline phosphatase family protein [Nitratireductor sp. XY-223]